MFDAFVFYPQTGSQEWTIPYTDHWISVDKGIMLHGRHYDIGSPTTAIYCHGNAGNLSQREDTVKFLSRECRSNVFIFDYRGFGLSSGIPQCHEALTDGVKVLIYVKNFSSRIYLFGESLGVSVAAFMNRAIPVEKMILAFGFYRLANMVPSYISWLLPEMDTAKYLQGNLTPTLILHSRSDEVIPFQHGVALGKLPNCRFQEITGTHCTPDFGTKISEFMK